MLSRFALVSGVGWLIDFSVFTLLCQHIPVYLANTVGACLAVLFVFFSSLRPIFLYAGQRVSQKLLRYVAYQVVAIWLASLLIDLLSTAWWGPIGAKVLVTPITFASNFFFMRWLAAQDS